MLPTVDVVGRAVRAVLVMMCTAIELAPVRVKGEAAVAVLMIPPIGSLKIAFALKA
jgi:hypothetical protein